MNNNNTTVAFHPSHPAVEAASKELQLSSLEMNKLAMTGPDSHPIEAAFVGSSRFSERISGWRQNGAFWSIAWGFGLGSAFFWVPSLRPLLVMGLLFGWIFGTREGAIIAGSLSAIRTEKIRHRPQPEALALALRR